VPWVKASGVSVTQICKGDGVQFPLLMFGTARLEPRHPVDDDAARAERRALPDLICTNCGGRWRTLFGCGDG
jgi:hypothetical protein